MSLLDQLVAHWKMNETTGTREDAHADHDLTPNGSVGWAAGKLGNAALFSDTSGNSLDRNPISVDLDVGDKTMTFAWWVYTAAAGGSEMWNFGEDCYIWHQIEPTNSILIQWGGAGFVPTLPLGPDAWHLCILSYDHVTDVLRWRMDNGTAQEFTGATAPASAAAVGIKMGSLGGGLITKRLDSFSRWNRKLTVQEEEDIWNDGDGLDYPFTLVGGSLDAGFWFPP